MRKLLAAIFVALALGAGLAVYSRQARGPSSTPSITTVPANGRSRAEWGKYGYGLRNGPGARPYNLPVAIHVEAEATPHVRLVLDVQDAADYHFVELTTERVWIGLVESGLEAPLGTSVGEGLRTGTTNAVIVKRRSGSLAVVLNDRVVATAETDGKAGGQLGAGMLGDEATVRLRAPQVCNPVLVNDDFMRTAAEGGAWSVLDGSWEVSSVRSPSLSSNAFHYVGSSTGGNPPATVVRGEWFWDDYRFTVNCRSLGKEDVGILVYYRDRDNYTLFRWNGGRSGRKQLVRRWHGKEEVLAEQPGGYASDVWYDLEVEVAGQRVRAAIDGHRVFEVEDSTLVCGKIGLYTATPIPAAAHFDDVAVHTTRGFVDDFSTVAAGRWLRLRGEWTQQQEADGHVCMVTAEEPAKAIVGSRRWRDYTASTIVRVPRGIGPESEVGLVSRYTDEMNYALFAWRPAAGTARIETIVDGKTVERSDVAAPKGPVGTSHVLRLGWKNAVALASVDGRHVGSAAALGLERGMMGLYAARASDVAFEEVRARFPRPPRRVPTHKVFEREATMQIWAGAASDWETTYQTLDRRTVRPNWHRASCFGDSTIQLDLKTEPSRTKTSEPSCRLVLAAESVKNVLSGYTLVVKWPARSAGSGGRAAILRGDRTVAETALPKGRTFRRLRFERLGAHVLASVNDEHILIWRDPEPLQGCRVAYAARGIAIDKEDVSVFSDNLRVYTFSTAPKDWRSGGGIWAVTNRWECDPRWSFFSGVPDRGKLAALWNKCGFSGDVCVEFAVGPKMERARGGSYQYARDFNAVLCAEGSDLASGYGFLFGGWNNSTTAITRRGKVVARSSYVIPRSSSIHRRWFYIKAEKRGDTLSYWIDGSRVLTWKDPQPLTGDRAAIWTWDCGVMISRVRLSASTVTPCELPGKPVGSPQMDYPMK